MQIEFLRSIATDRGSFTNGQIVTVRSLPRTWQAWLETGVIRIVPEDQTETAVAPALPERAVVRQSRRDRRAARRPPLAR
jgi:hypothetical protein